MDFASKAHRSTVRLFVGLSLTPEVRHTLKNAALPNFHSPQWRPLEDKGWHVTALFIGERGIEELEALSALVAETARATRPFTLKNGRILTMPEESPSMGWVRFDPHAELITLHHELARATNSPPAPFSPYWPHITLARSSRPAPPINGPLILDELLFDSLTLFRSDATLNGRVHAPTNTWELGKPTEKL